MALYEKVEKGRYILLYDQLKPGDTFKNEDGEEEVKQIENAIEVIPHPIVIDGQEHPLYMNIEDVQNRPLFEEIDEIEEDNKLLEQYKMELKENIQENEFEIDFNNKEIYINKLIIKPGEIDFQQLVDRIIEEEERKEGKNENKIKINMNFIETEVLGGLNKIIGLTSVFMGKVFNLYNGTFSNCSDLEEVYLPKTITTIPKCCFYDCHNLTMITGGEYVQVIEDYAFANCQKLLFMNLYRTRYIGEYAFYKCKKLEKIAYVLDFIEYIGKDAFSGTDVFHIVTRRILIYSKRIAIRISRKLRILTVKEEIPSEILIKEMKLPTEEELDIIKKKLNIYYNLKDENPKELRKILYNLRDFSEEYELHREWHHRSYDLHFLNPFGPNYERAIEEWFGFEPHEIEIEGDPTMKRRPIYLIHEESEEDTNSVSTDNSDIDSDDDSDDSDDDDFDDEDLDTDDLDTDDEYFDSDESE